MENLILVLVEIIRERIFGNARRLWLNVQGLILDVATFNIDNLFKRHANRDSTFQGK